MFYSDGLVENRVRGLDAGLDELVRVAASAQDDDVTVLVMHVPVGAAADGGSPELQWALR